MLEKKVTINLFKVQQTMISTIIVMTVAGRTKGSIARDLGCSSATVDNVRHRAQRQGREGLRRGKPPGRPSRATAQYRAALRQTVQTSPQRVGCGFRVWSVARLGQHLQKQTGISFSEDQLEIYWLPPYCPSLNLIERLWGHLKRTVLANVLYHSLDDLVRAFRTGVRRLSGHRERMGFLFTPEKDTDATPTQLLKLAA